ncbi:hypothetical protein P3L10_030510 [Capsicum annuum]
MDFMRLTVESWNAKHKEEADNTFTDLTIKYNEILKENRKKSYDMTVRASTEFLHTVTDGAKTFRVCLQSQKYSYGQFQLDEIPCVTPQEPIPKRHTVLKATRGLKQIL